MVTKKPTTKKATTKKAMAKKTDKKPVYKQWWFWVIIAVVVVGIGGMGASKQNQGTGNFTNQAGSVTDYTGKDAKEAYGELSGAGYDVKFEFDRSNNGGFTADKFQEYALAQFNSSSYNEMPFTVTKQSVLGKTVTLSIDYASSLAADKEREERKAALEAKLGSIEAMTACEQYGKRNYRNFKIHSILGKIAEEPADDNTWLLKYKVDADGYEGLTMECYVSGTSANPVITQFVVY